MLAAYYTDHFVLPLPAGHRFPMQKYRMIREQCAAVPGIQFFEAPAATNGQLALAHHPDYISAVTTGTLSAAGQKDIGFPWTPQMVERSRRSTGATIAACRHVLMHPEDRIAVNLAGGTHHAYSNRGGGFCVFNDAAVAARLMQAERWVSRVAIVDLDVHQGNGTASILQNDNSVFTLSLHGASNYPFVKEQSDLDVPLSDGINDADYLDALSNAQDQMARRFAPELVIYLAGADPHQDDRLGRLGLSAAGLLERDRMVFERFVRGSKPVPVVVVMAGGYGKDILQTVEIHVATISLAATYATCAMPG